MSAAATGTVDKPTMREVMGHFVSGIVVVTGIDATGSGTAEPVGFTCQSFFSLSLDPPLISFSPSRTSVTWPRIRRAGAFCVNVLAAHHSGHSQAFARSGGDKFAGIDWAPAPSGAPVLDGVCAWVDCTLEAEHDGGDHTIVVGRVTGLGADAAGSPLLYHRGAYGLTVPLPSV